MGTIQSCIAAIEKSDTPRKLEIIVVDDGENPGLTEALSKTSASIRRTGGSGSAAIARNTGAEDFDHGALVFIDSDVMVLPDTISRLVEPILGGQTDAVVGNYSKDVSGLSFAARYKQLYISHIYDRREGYLRNDFWTAIGAVDAEAFHALGGFDGRFLGACGEDGELGVRLTAAGKRILGIPGARGHHRHHLSFKNLVLNDWRKGRVALENRAAAKGALADNKHATGRDVISVLLAGALIAGCVLMAATTPALWAVSFIILLLAYAMARLDVLAQFRSQGAAFLTQAFGAMLVLDLVRGACVGAQIIRPAGRKRKADVEAWESAHA
jgi:glycosyltransferase involved in cell wall biosynthesis